MEVTGLYVEVKVWNLRSELSNEKNWLFRVYIRMDVYIGDEISSCSYVGIIS